MGTNVHDNSNPMHTCSSYTGKRREPANVVRRIIRQDSILPPNTTTTISTSVTEQPTTIVRDLAIAVGLSFTLCASATVVQTLHEHYKKRKSVLSLFQCF